MVITDTAASHCQYTVICSIIITNHWYLFIYLFIYYIYYLFILRNIYIPCDRENY